MNGSAARQIRRDIRRAMGPVALSTFEAHAEAIGALRAQIVVLCQRQDQIEAIQRTLVETMGKHATSIGSFSFSVPYQADQIADLRGWRDRGFLGRVLWVLTGR